MLLLQIIVKNQPKINKLNLGKNLYKYFLEGNEANQRVLLVKLTVKISFTIEIQSLGL